MNSIYIFPTCDVHLLRSPAPTSVQLVPSLFSNGTPPLPSSSLAYEGFGFPASVTPDGVVSPSTESQLSGSSVGVVSYTSAPNAPTVRGLVRVSVHNSISEFVVANNRVTMFAGTGPRYLSIIARFDDGVTGDVSRHPGLFSYSTDPTGIVTVSNDGGITALGAVGRTDVVVTYNGQSQRVPVFVRESPTERPILRRIHGAGDYRYRKNLLILAEGFGNTVDDMTLFDQVAARLVSRLFESSAHSPFHLLKDDFNVWVAFEPSMERGISVGPTVLAQASINDHYQPGAPIPLGSGSGPSLPISQSELVSMIGLPDGTGPMTTGDLRTALARYGLHYDEPTAEAILNTWLLQQNATFLRPRDSRYGLTYGIRSGDLLPQSPSSVPGIRNENEFNVPTLTSLMISTDQRRLITDLDTFGDYLASLRYGSNSPNNPNFHIGETWTKDQADYGRVFILVNDQLFGGGRFDPHFVAASIFGDGAVHVVGSGLCRDHEPAPSQESVHAAPTDAIIDTFAHELGHGFDLGDEYEGNSGRAPASAQIDLEKGYNVHHAASLAGTGAGRIDVTRIKWNWHRVELASVLSAPVDVGDVHADGTFTVHIDEDAARLWRDARGNAGTQVLRVFLRTAALSANGPTAVFGPFTLEPFDRTRAQGTIRLRGSAAGVTDLAAGAVVYSAKRDAAGEPMRLISPRVLEYLSTSGPFPRTGAADCSRASAARMLPPADIAGLAYPRIRYQLIGLYEGGGTWNCGAYRACGACKLRAQTAAESDGVFDREASEPFCFVCKYVIVNAVNPARLGDLDAEYPR